MSFHIWSVLVHTQVSTLCVNSGGREQNMEYIYFFLTSKRAYKYQGTEKRSSCQQHDQISFGKHSRGSHMMCNKSENKITSYPLILFYFNKTLPNRFLAFDVNPFPFSSC